MNIDEITRRLLAGGNISREEAVALVSYPDLNALCDAADTVSRHFLGNRVDSCSIINARSGLCSEDCKWCAQASRHHTGCKTYNFVDRDEAMELARENKKAGVQRFSLVTSGRAVTAADLDKFCTLIRDIHEDTGLYLCASMGLLGEEDMEKLAAAGVKRYHCNLETSSKVFPTLCSTHSHDDKKRTIAAAKKAGMQICSGGIIGMGETMGDRIDFAFELRALGVDSVPVNILIPVAGTPMENQPLISEEEIIRTIAIFRLIMPATSIRFAGGRKRLSRESMLRILRGGLNGLMIGDMLTSIGTSVAEDRNLIAEADMHL